MPEGPSSEDRDVARRSRAVPLFALILAIGLLAVAVGAAAADHGRQRDVLSRQLSAEATEQTQNLENYFARARSLTSVTASNPAYRGFYEQSGSRLEKIRGGGRIIREANAGLAYLEELFRGSIGEACFIDRTGPENARAIRGRVEPLANLSPDETAAPFFKPTFALKPGQIYQARPYLSPDTSEWVVSNSTPVATRDGAVRAIVHFEITMESFRRQAASTSDQFDVAIVEANSGKVVADSRYPQPAGEGSPLGRPADRDFARWFSAAGRAFPEGTLDVDGRPSVFRRLESGPHNANQWVVVASAGVATSSWLEQLGLAELAMIAFSLLLLCFAIVSFRASEARLHAAAVTDSLTALGNRRKLVADLESGLSGASTQRPLLLVLFDLDGFKSYNDSFGHGAGDAHCWCGWRRRWARRWRDRAAPTAWAATNSACSRRCPSTTPWGSSRRPRMPCRTMARASPLPRPTGRCCCRWTPMRPPRRCGWPTSGCTRTGVPAGRRPRPPRLLPAFRLPIGPWGRHRDAVRRAGRGMAGAPPACVRRGRPRRGPLPRGLPGRMS